jgi:hypothetical protein
LPSLWSAASRADGSQDLLVLPIPTKPKNQGREILPPFFIVGASYNLHGIVTCKLPNCSYKRVINPYGSVLLSRDQAPGDKEYDSWLERLRSQHSGQPKLAKGKTLLDFLRDSQLIKKYAPCFLLPPSGGLSSRSESLMEGIPWLAYPAMHLLSAVMVTETKIQGFESLHEPNYVKWCAAELKEALLKKFCVNPDEENRFNRHYLLPGREIEIGFMECLEIVGCDVESFVSQVNDYAADVSRQASTTEASVQKY